MAEQSETTQTEVLLNNLVNLLSEYKDMWYPPSVVTKGMYKEGAVGKKQFNDLIIKTKSLKSRVNKSFKVVTKKDRLIPYYIKPELQKFIGSNEITSDKYVVAFIHNYFILNNLYNPDSKGYIIPNQELKDLFRDQFVEGIGKNNTVIMTEDGELTVREVVKNSKGEEKQIKGFQHSEVLELLSPMYIKVRKDKTSDEKKRKQPSVITDELVQKLKDEKEIQDNISQYRNRVSKREEVIRNLEESISISEKYGDAKDMKRKIEEEKVQLGSLKKEFREFCDKVKFPYNRKYFK